MNAGDEATETVASDMFFGLAAILIVILCLASQSLSAAVAERGQVTDPAKLEQAARQSGLTLAIADKDGVTLTATGLNPRRLPLDEIAGADLGFWAAGPATVLVLEDAADSAFLFDTALARAGVTQVSRLRLATPCPAPRFVTGGVVCE